ncbi:MAG: tetratricopeptide repeat protein [Planctomycetota bacterium]
MRGGLVRIVAVALALAAAGCRLPGREGPVSQSLVASRQFCQQGVAAIERDEWEQAEKLLADAVKTCPSDPDARRHYAEALWHRGEHKEAVNELEEACRQALDDPSLHVLLAERRLAMGHVELARQGAQSAIDLDPKHAGAWALRGRVSRAHGQTSQALADYHRALGLAPHDRAILLEIAELYRELNRPERALATLHTLSDAYSPGQEPQQVLYFEGLAYEALQRWDEAVESFSAARNRQRPTPEILFRLARAEWFAGRPAQAAAAAREALALDPGHQPSRELLDRAELALRSDGPLRR